MAVSALMVTTPKPMTHIQTLNPTTTNFSSKPTHSSCCSCSSSSSPSLSTTEKNAKVSWASSNRTKRNWVLDMGIGLFAASVVALSPMEAHATRIEYYATVEEPSCEMNFVRSGLGFCDVSPGFGVDAPRGELINGVIPFKETCITCQGRDSVSLAPNRQAASVLIHYTARFADGTVFDSSYKRGRPLTMRIGVGKVLRGLDQGIFGGDGVPPMQIGGKRKLHIPSQLAYGPEPAGCFSGDCNIPGNATLLYEINFVEIYSGNRPLPANR